MAKLLGYTVTSSKNVECLKMFLVNPFDKETLHSELSGIIELPKKSFLDCEQPGNSELFSK